MDALKNALSIVPSGTAATIIVGHALLTKLMMTAMFRLKLTMKSTPKAECTKILKSQFYKRVRSSAEPTFAVDAALDGGARDSLVDLCTGLVGTTQ